MSPKEKIEVKAELPVYSGNVDCWMLHISG